MLTVITWTPKISASSFWERARRSRSVLRLFTAAGLQLSQLSQRRQLDSLAYAAPAPSPRMSDFMTCSGRARRGSTAPRPRMIAAALQANAERKLDDRVEFRAGDVRALPFPDASFDTARQVSALRWRVLHCRTPPRWRACCSRPKSWSPRLPKDEEHKHPMPDMGGMDM
jgi:hypothetical protein